MDTGVSVIFIQGSVDTGCQMCVDLTRVDLFRDLSSATLARFLALGRRRSFPDGAVLVRQDAPNGWLHLITAGQVLLEQEHPGCVIPTRIGVLRSGDVIGAEWLEDGGSPTATARALDEVQTFCVSHLAVAVVLLQFPDGNAPFYEALRRLVTHGEPSRALAQ
jgi:CRP-like cAMP-binding protein